MDYSNTENKKRQRRQKSARKKVKNSVGSIVIRVIVAVVLIGGFASAGALIGIYMGIIEDAPKLGTVEIQPDIFTSIIYAKDLDHEIDRLQGEENREYVVSALIPENLKNAFVAIEDERFYAHNGVDFKGMVRALYVNLTQNKSQGASTITQQLIKNGVMKINRNTLETKLKEQYLAIEYEKALSNPPNRFSKMEAKDYILEVYLNTIGLGHGLNGVQTAARYYFDKEVSELTLSECAVIAAITQNPSKYAPDVNPENNRERQKNVLDKMLELEMITQLEYDRAIADDVYVRVTRGSIEQEETIYHSFFVDRLITQVSLDLQEQMGLQPAEASNWIYNKGLKIIATQDMNMQEIVDEAYMDDSFFPASDFEIDVHYTVSFKNSVTGQTEHKEKIGPVKTEEEIDGLVESFKNELLGQNDEVIADKIIPIPQPQSAMVIMDYRTGEVLAMTGGRGQKLGNRTLNRATDSKRQPGSVFKVLASYAPAIDIGRITPATVIDDAPFENNGKEFKNWYGGYRGPSTVRVGIRDSMNILAVKNMFETGIDTCYDYLMNMGFTTLVDREVINGQVFTDKNLATALGGLTYGVTQLEATAAYGTIANQGIYNKPIFYTKVLDHDNNVLLENDPQPRQVLKATSAYLLTDMMKDVVTGGTGGKARFKEINMPIAGKTGTTTDTKDLTFVGYTPYYVAGIWLGFDQPKIIQEDKGYHLLLWSYIMEKIHQNLEPREFAMPQGISSATVCRISGNLASDACIQSGTVITDIFAAGTQPTQYCDSQHAVEEPEEEIEETPEPDYYTDPYGNLQTAPPLSTDPPLSAEESFTITPRPVMPDATETPPENNNGPVVPSESDPIIGGTSGQDQNLPVMDEPGTIDGFSP